MKRLVAAVLTAVALLTPIPAPGAVQPPPAQEEFVPVDQLPADEQLPAAPLVITAYAFIWVALLVYLWALWRKAGALDRELAELRRLVSARR